MKLIRIWLLVALTVLGGTLAADDRADDLGVNINTADAETLADALEGVGDARARAIVRYREAHGAFSAPEDLVEVSGIGPQVLERNRGRIRTGD